MAQNKWYACSSLTPADENSLHKIPNPGAYTSLNNNDKCWYFDVTGGFMRPYVYDASSTATDDGLFVVTPTGNTGPGRWLAKKSAQSGIYFHGIITPKFDATVSESGGTVTMSLTGQSGPADLAVVFSDGQHFLDCTPAKTIALTTGTDTVPVENYIYILKSAPTVLVKSTSDWPSAEHAKVAYFLVPSATFVSSNGCYINQNWNDGSDPSGQGHLTHITENIRLTMNGAHYHSGVAGAATGSAYIEITGTSPSVVEFKSSAGVAYQMHKHTVPAFDMSGTDLCLVVNDNTTPYKDITDLASITADAAGVSLSNKYFNLVFWVALNKSGSYSPLLVNLPSGSYNTATAAIQDNNGHDVYDIPSYFKEESSTGMLVCRLTCQQNASGTWTLANTTDLRGRTPGTASGTNFGSATEFSDALFAIFDNADDTKQIDFELSGLTTALTRTITPADADMKLLSAVNHDDLTDGNETTLHKHASVPAITDTGDATAAAIPSGVEIDNSGDKIEITNVAGLAKIINKTDGGSLELGTEIATDTEQIHVRCETDGELTLPLGRLKLLERSADPAEPAEGECIIWMSDGTGKGDDGDILMASKAGGTTRYSVIFDHSAGTAW
jgi:hypothetical protein